MTEPTRPVLQGQPETLPAIRPEIQAAIDTEGVYITCSPLIAGEAIVVSNEGALFSVVLDKQLDPARFMESASISGPFRAGDDLAATKAENASLKETLAAIRFHLRRNDHVTLPTGTMCTNLILSTIDKHLDEPTP